MSRAEPLTIWHRVANYARQNRHYKLTPKQSRRARKKDDKHLNGGSRFADPS
jgi:hypothetical protein